MNRKDWTPDLVIAVFVIMICAALRFLNINGEVWSVMLLAVAWVFGGQYEKRRYTRRAEENGRRRAAEDH